MSDGTWELSARVDLDPQLVLDALYEHNVLPNVIDAWVKERGLSAAFVYSEDRVQLLITGQVE